MLAGCFKDKFALDRAMALLKASDTMTVDMCANLAYSKGYTVIGIQYAKECYAGNDVTAATRWGQASNCDSKCYSDPDGTCGGGLANSIYLLPGQNGALQPAPSSTPTVKSSLGITPQGKPLWSPAYNNCKAINIMLMCRGHW